MSRPLALASGAVLLGLYLSGLASLGLTGPDEPRYVSIGRHMAASGDWITPRLWGEPWFEKPALLYWMNAAAFRFGVDADWAPRLPIALCAFAFLVFFYLNLKRQFNPFVASAATALLATSALWIGLSHAAVTDIPMAVTFAAAMLLLLPLAERGKGSPTAAAALLGLSVLAKGLVPLVLALPFLWFGWRRWKEWLRPRPIVAFLLVTLPWYIAVSLRNPDFLNVFFWRHQFGRFASGELQHVQPFWFYAPVLIGALFPSILFAAFAFHRPLYADRRLRFLLALFVFGFVFFSASTNKLPSYLLPLLPFVSILTAVGIDAARRTNPNPLAAVTAASTLLLPLFVIAGGLLPRALGDGLRTAFPVDLTTTGRVAASIPVVIVSCFATMLMSRERALILWFALCSAGWIYIEYAALPWVDRTGSARRLWSELPEPKRAFCMDGLSRNWVYGLNYYSVKPLPVCASAASVPAIIPGNTAGALPRLRIAPQ